MSVDVLVLNSGEWVLTDELQATPWHILIYRQKCERSNELHLWLPRDAAAGGRPYAFKRYWCEEETRWCVELPTDPDRSPALPPPATERTAIRFSASDGRVLWASTPAARGLGDLTDLELRRLRLEAAPGPYTLI